MVQEAAYTREAENTNEALRDLPSGKLAYTLRNDYLFKAVLQKNRKALKGLLCALLGYEDTQIKDIELLNPIELGKSIEDKTCILDIKLVLNNELVLNIELQVNKLDGWSERSLVYLCRAFDHLKKGEAYMEFRDVMHIGILDFHLPGHTPLFYSEYKMQNTINHEVYSDKFVLRVLDLKVLEELEKTGGEVSVRALFPNLPEKTIVPANYQELFEWARVFKATTWEELKALATENQSIAETVVTIRELTEDDKIRMQCEAREKYEHDIASYIGMGRREGLEEGERIGREEGERIGQEQGIARLSGLISRLQQEGRSELIVQVAEDRELRQRLLGEYGL
ncbi:MAG: Rpn family recombination-promoting nuclease/putative transposase [Lachnospiraceae bacterium]|nr:Rpn family recombination-promoting nuclease/putative transposase [Lachnospiraceae bacterium]